MPYYENIVTTASDDASIKVWQIPENLADLPKISPSVIL